MAEQILSNTHPSFVVLTTAFLHLGSLESTLALCLGAMLHHEISYKMWQKNKNVALSRPWTGHLFTTKADTRQSLALFNFSKKHVYQVTQIFHWSVHVLKYGENTVNTDLEF